MTDRNSSEEVLSGSRELHLDLDTRLDLLHGRLSPTAKKQALVHLAECPVCEAEFRRLVVLNERLRASEIPRFEPSPATQSEEISEPESAQEGYKEEDPFPAWLIRRFSRLIILLRQPTFRYVGGALATVAVLALVFLPMFDGGDESQNLPWLPTASLQTGLRDFVELTGSEELAAGLKAYAERDMTSAIEYLERAKTTGDFENLRKAYLGSALASQDRFTEAGTLLETIDPQEMTEDFEEVRWILFIALTESGQQLRADSLLRVLAQERGTVAERARKRLDDQ